MEIVLFFQSTQRKSWRQKLAGVYMFARERNWFVQVVERYDGTRDIRHAIDVWKPIGCLVDRAMTDSAPPDRIFGSLPTVYLDQNPARRSHRHPSLVHDSGAEASLAGGELLRLGCASYAYIGTGKRHFWDSERLNRFRKEAKALGHHVTELPHDRLLEAIKSQPKPCGILGANDYCAIRAYTAAVAAGFAVPSDVAIAGVDNDELYCESPSPGLTSAEPDFEGAGYRLAQMLEAEIARNHGSNTRRREMPPVEKYGPLRLVRRGSTVSQPGTPPRVRRALEYIRRNACERGLRLDDVVAEMKCSRRLATMQFKKFTGRTILEEILEQRLQNTCNLLLRTKLPVSAVVSQSGYRSDSFVKKMFRRRFGVTMRQYRASAGHLDACRVNPERAPGACDL